MELKPFRDKRSAVASSTRSMRLVEYKYVAADATNAASANLRIIFSFVSNSASKGQISHASTQILGETAVSIVLCGLTLQLTCDQYLATFLRKQE